MEIVFTNHVLERFATRCNMNATREALKLIFETNRICKSWGNHWKVGKYTFVVIEEEGKYIVLTSLGAEERKIYKKKKLKKSVNDFKQYSGTDYEDIVDKSNLKYQDVFNSTNWVST